MTREASTEAVDAGSRPVRRRRFERAAPEHPLTPQKLEALRLIAESKFLATPQVAGLLGVSDRAARTHLRDLYDMGMLDVVAVPGVVLGSRALLAPKVHFPTRDGLKALERMDLLPEGAMRPAAYGPQQYAYLAHELRVRDFLVWLARSARANADQGHAVERWECGKGIAVGGAQPDAVLSYRFEPGVGGRRVVGLLEADRGTERGVSGGGADRWAAKLAAYGAVFAELSRDALFTATGFRRARLLVTVPDADRAAWILRRAEGGPAAPFLWVGVWEELSSADAYAPVWLRPDGHRHPLVPREGEKGFTQP